MELAMKLKLKLDGFNANTITDEQLEEIFSERGYNEEKAVRHFVTSIYLTQNTNFEYDITKLNTTQEFSNYLSDQFIYDFDECYCISWFIDDDGVFHSVCLDTNTFTIYQYKIETDKDKKLIENIRLESGQWELKIKG